VPFRPAAKSGRSPRHGSMEARLYSREKDDESRDRWPNGRFCRAARQGRRTGTQAKSLSVGAIGFERVCGRPFRKFRRGRLVFGVCSQASRERKELVDCQFARATRAAQEPETKARDHAADLRFDDRHGAQAPFPSLRTHNPFLPGAIDQDHAGEILEISSLAVQSGPKSLGTSQELNLAWDDTSPMRMEARQLTNLRMRTFIATPSARNVNSTEDPP